MRNTFGNIFTLTSFGESHGEAIGGIVDGMPAGIDVDMCFIQQELSRRRPGQSHITTGRKEQDEVRLLSGVFEGKTTGAPIAFIVFNQDQHSQDYEDMKALFRPSHADYTYYYKYGRPHIFHGALHSQRLQNCDRSGRALQHDRDEHAYQKSKHMIFGKRRHQGNKRFTSTQWLHG